MTNTHENTTTTLHKTRITVHTLEQGERVVHLVDGGVAGGVGRVVGVRRGRLEARHDRRQRLAHRRTGGRQRLGCLLVLVVAANNPCSLPGEGGSWLE